MCYRALKLRPVQWAQPPRASPVRLVAPLDAQARLMLHDNAFENGGPDNIRKDGASPNNGRRAVLRDQVRPLTLPRGYGYPTAPEDNWKMI